MVFVLAGVLTESHNLGCSGFAGDVKTRHPNRCRRAAVLEKALAKLSNFGPVGAEAEDATLVNDVQRVTASAAAFLGGIDTIVVEKPEGWSSAILSAVPFHTSAWRFPPGVALSPYPT